MAGIIWFSGEEESSEKALLWWKMNVFQLFFSKTISKVDNQVYTFLIDYRKTVLWKTCYEKFYVCLKSQNFILS